MGALRLKIKKELHYKKGPTSGGCSQCKEYVHKYPAKKIGGEVFSEEPRCKVIGLKDGRLYRINPEYICDKFDNQAYLKKLRGY